MRKILPLIPLPSNLNISDYYVIFGQAENRLNILESNNTTKKTKLKFKGYSDEENKTRIRNLADGCCAYCGIRVNSTSTETVEHFRPKAELHFKQNYLKVDGLNSLKRSGKHTLLIEKCDYGYFLWGDDGHNLLPACECCNTGQGNNGIFISTSTTLDNGNVEYNIPYGKKNLFPILLKRGVDIRMKKQYVQDVNDEYSLLFNPYVDDPENLFRYKASAPSSSGNQQLIKIRPNKGLSKEEHLKAQISINIFGLNRSHLCILRADLSSQLNSIAREVYELISSGNNNLNSWVMCTSSLIKYFDKKHANLLGFCCVNFGWLVDRVYIEVLRVFPGQVALTNIDLFESKVDELSEFCRQNPITSSHNDDVRSLFRNM